MKSPDRWGEPKERVLFFRRGDEVAMWSPEVPTRIDYLYLTGGGKLRMVMVGTTILYSESCWSARESIGVLSPGVALVVQAEDAQQAIVSYRELTDPPFGKLEA